MEERRNPEIPDLEEECADSFDDEEIPDLIPCGIPPCDHWELVITHAGEGGGAESDHNIGGLPYYDDPFIIHRPCPALRYLSASGTICTLHFILRLGDRLTERRNMILLLLANRDLPAFSSFLFVP